MVAAFEARAKELYGERDHGPRVAAPGPSPPGGLESLTAATPAQTAPIAGSRQASARRAADGRPLGAIAPEQRRRASVSAGGQARCPRSATRRGGAAWHDGLRRRHRGSDGGQRGLPAGPLHRDASAAGAHGLADRARRSASGSARAKRDQFFCVEAGAGRDRDRRPRPSDRGSTSQALVPAGARYDVINAGDERPQALRSLRPARGPRRGRASRNSAEAEPPVGAPPSGDAAEAGLIIRQARSRGYDLQVIGSDALHQRIRLAPRRPGRGRRAVRVDGRSARQREAAAIVEQFRADGYEPEGSTLWGPGLGAGG